jgi:hypothetical protein
MKGTEVFTLIAAIAGFIVGVFLLLADAGARKSRRKSDAEDTAEVSPLLGVVLPNTKLWAAVVSEEEDRKEEKN